MLSKKLNLSWTWNIYLKILDYTVAMENGCPNIYQPFSATTVPYWHWADAFIQSNSIQYLLQWK